MFDVLPEEQRQRKVLEIWKQPEHKINVISEKWTDTVRNPRNYQDRKKMRKYNVKISM